MTIYIGLKNQVFQLPNRTIIGRGEPFTCLNDSYDVARSHALIVHKGNKWFIKDLGTKTGIKVNGQTIKAKKLFEIKPADTITIGSQSLNLLATRPEGQIVEVKSARYIEKALLLKYIVLALYALVVLQFWMTFGSKDWILFLFSAGLCSVPVSLFILFIDKSAQLNAVKEILYNDEGFTAHYCDGSNMTFKSKSIQSWSLNRLTGMSIIMNGEIYRLALRGQFQSFVEYMNKTHTAKFVEAKYTHIIVVSLAILVLDFFIHGEISVWFTLGLSVVMLSIFFNKKLSSYFQIDKKQLKAGRVFAPLGFVLSISLCYETHQTKKFMAGCMAGDDQSCKVLDFGHVPLKSKNYPEVVQKSCKAGNPVACDIQKGLAGREVAGK